MATGRIARYRGAVRGRLRVAFAEGHPPRLVAASFAIGLFVTALPSLGAGLVLAGWLGYRFEWANRVALLTAAAIFNPIAKSSVYVASFVAGRAVLGPIPDVTVTDVGLDAGPDVLARVLVGNGILAVAFAVVGYALAYRVVLAYRRRD